MRIDGSCHCGAVRYEADVDATRVAICHCRDCQMLTGTAFRVTVPAAAESFRLLAGTPRTYVKTAQSGRRRLQAFCGTCGSPLYAAAVDEAGRVGPEYGIRVGTIRQRRSLEPERQFWRTSALPWVPDMEELETFPLD